MLFVLQIPILTFSCRLHLLIFTRNLFANAVNNAFLDGADTFAINALVMALAVSILESAV